MGINVIIETDGEGFRLTELSQEFKGLTDIKGSSIEAILEEVERQTCQPASQIPVSRHLRIDR